MCKVREVAIPLICFTTLSSVFRGYSGMTKLLLQLVEERKHLQKTDISQRHETDILNTSFLLSVQVSFSTLDSSVRSHAQGFSFVLGQIYMGLTGLEVHSHVSQGTMCKKCLCHAGICGEGVDPSYSIDSLNGGATRCQTPMMYPGRMPVHLF